jgi:GTPase SAR1 family protein
MILYDIISSTTFNSIGKWLTELRENSDSRIVVMLVGNKVDLEEMRSVSTQDGINLAQREDLLFFETSAKDTTNVHDAFVQLVEHVISVLDAGGFVQIMGAKDSEPRKRGVMIPGQTHKKCC